MGLKKHSALPLLTAIFLFLFRSFTPMVLAEEITVTGNGSGSSNEVVVTTTTQTTIQQTNQADVTNSVSEDANTGGNEASGNTQGAVTIETGDVSQTLSVENSLNTSEVEAPCCPSDISVEISQNGSDSSNSVSLISQGSTDVAISQNASVTNSVSGSANTGENKANDNTGANILIDTGNIFVNGGIKNGPVNVYNVQGGLGGQSASAWVSENGSGSTNLITLLLSDLATLYLQNNANINNEVNWDLNTGGNKANGNTSADVEIRTGDIFFNFLIENDPINVGGVAWGCCPLPGDGGNGGPPPPPPGGDGDGDGDGDGAGAPGPSVAGAGAGGVILALAETSGEGYPMVIIGLGLIAAGASLVKKKKFV